MGPVWIMNTWSQNTNWELTAREKIVLSKWCVGRLRERPAKFSPAFLQATAVIIMWDPSREWTKLGGKAVLWRLTMTYMWMKWLHIKSYGDDEHGGIQNITIASVQIKQEYLTFSVSRCNVKIWREVLTCTKIKNWANCVSKSREKFPSLMVINMSKDLQDAFPVYGKVAQPEVQAGLSTELADFQLQLSFHRKILW